MTLTKRPMLACECDPAFIKYPVIVQPKLDGIRALIHQGVAYSRSLKPIRNRYIQEQIALHREVLEGLDGELMVGPPYNPDVYRVTSSGVMSEHGIPNFLYYIFDLWDTPDASYETRRNAILHRNVPLDVVEYVASYLAGDERELMEIHHQFISQGYEGSILRHPQGTYKYNRSTAREGFLIKLKDFKDSEATIIGFEPRYHNANPAELDERGFTKRSSHQENKVALDTLGALRVKNARGDEFRIGTGFDDALRLQIWKNRDQLVDAIVKFKYHESGNYSLPRFPVFLGFRDPLDLDQEGEISYVKEA